MKYIPSLKQYFILLFLVTLGILVFPQHVFAADVLVGATRTGLFERGGHRLVVTTGPTTAYAFFLNSSTRVSYRKTTDSGVTWGGEVVFNVNVTTPKFDIWFDKWTPGDTGTVIHILMLETTGTDEIRYINLDVSDDSVSSEVVIVADTVDSGPLWDLSMPAITKARGGNLYVQYWGDALGSHGFYRSTDGGLNWTLRTDGADGNAVDGVMLFPGNETDNQDIWMTYWDRSADEVSLKVYDDSANTWAETSISTGIVDTNVYFQKCGSIRHSDNHLILAVWSELDATTADLKVWDINGSGSITAKTDVLTDTSEAAGCGITINQRNDDIYITYIKGTAFGSLVDTFYKLSTDGAGIWGSETAMSEDTNDDHSKISAPLSIDDNGGLFLPVWVNDDLDQLFVNANNAVTIAASSTTPGKRRQPAFYFTHNSTKVTSITSDSALVTWDTSIPTDTQLNWSTSLAEVLQQSSVQEYDLLKSHSVSLDNLTPNTTYYYVIHATAPTRGNIAQGSFSFTTLPTEDTGSGGTGESDDKLLEELKQRIIELQFQLLTLMGQLLSMLVGRL